jgi:hypothetical protein
MYLDPGFGSLAIQLIIATIATVSSMLIAMKKRIRILFFKKNKNEKQKAQDEQDE